MQSAMYLVHFLTVAAGTKPNKNKYSEKNIFVIA